MKLSCNSQKDVCFGRLTRTHIEPKSNVENPLENFLIIKDMNIIERGPDEID